MAARLRFRARLRAANERDATLTVRRYEVTHDRVDADSVVHPHARHVRDVDADGDDRYVRETFQPFAKAREARVVRKTPGEGEDTVDARLG